MVREADKMGLVVLPVRGGVLGEPEFHRYENVAGDDADVLSTALNMAYEHAALIPPEILLPIDLPDAGPLTELLTERRGKAVTLRRPQRGSKARLMEMAHKNVVVRFENADAPEARRQQALESIREVLQLPAPPHRMECFDNSHLGGNTPVAAMAVFIDGAPVKAAYRRYRIKTAMGGDDYAGMREILTRRLTRGLKEGELPDLLVIDGGKGQVGVAQAVLEDLGLDDLPMVGISKPRTEHAKGQRSATDKLVRYHLKDPLRLPARHPGLRMLQYLRDETHNAAVTYQRKARTKAKVRSVLEDIPGVGPAKRRALLKHFGSIPKILQATEEQLAETPSFGPASAARLYAALRARQGRS